MFDGNTLVLGRLEIIFGNPFRVPEVGVKHFAAWHTPYYIYLWCGQFGICWRKYS